MADESDVESSLVALIATAIYPSGTGALSVLSGNAQCRVFRGWPVEANLKRDLSSGIGNVSVYARNGVEHNVTHYNPERQEISRSPITLTAVVTDNTVMIDGSGIAVPQTVSIRVGHQITVAYPVQVGDTMTSIATALATLLAAQIPGTTNLGQVITVPVSAHRGLITTRVTTLGVVGREVKRQDKSFQISLWAPTPELRDSLAKTIDPVLADTKFIFFQDGSCGYLKYEFTILLDTPQEEGLYRRDLFYNVEYPTLRVEQAYEIGTIDLEHAGSQSDPLFSVPGAPPVIPIII